MRAVKEYFLLTAQTPGELVKLVNNAINKENKQPYGGGPTMIPGQGGPALCQAMAFYHEEGI